jgi:hypothetical protein
MSVLLCSSRDFFASLSFCLLYAVIVVVVVVLRDNFENAIFFIDERRNSSYKTPMAGGSSKRGNGISIFIK